MPSRSSTRRLDPPRGVETGLFQDGWVEITAPNGDLEVGAEIVVPS